MIRIIKIILSIVGVSLIGLLAYQGISYKLEQLKTADAGISPVTAEVRDKQLDCLAKNIYHEAKGEPFEGKVAVAQVTINRANSGQFPSDICKVVYQKNVVYEKVLCQFSWYCDGKSDIMRNASKREEIIKFTEYVLSNKFDLDITDGATHYHADYVYPAWAKTKTKTIEIGDHIFYRWEK